MHSWRKTSRSYQATGVCGKEEIAPPAEGQKFILGVKGLLYVEYSVQWGKKDQHSQYGAIAPNPAWRLVNFLKTIRNEQGKILIEGFYEDVAPPTPAEKELIRANEFSVEELQKGARN